jgi:hypothetical protein
MKIELAAPTRKMPIAKATRPMSKRHNTRPTALNPAAISIDRRSPMRVARIPEGIFVTSAPSPRVATTNDATAIVAPRSMALIAMTGRIAP